MLQNYFTTAFRNLQKNRVFTFINLVGLSLGLSAFILIFQYVSFEKSVNGFHKNLPNLYRVLLEVSFLNETNTWESVPPALGPLAKDNFGEVDSYCRVIAGSGNGIVTRDEAGKEELKSFREERIVYADANFFDVFSFPILKGNASGISKPNMVAISQSTAIKYFEKENPLGKVLTLNNQFGTTLFTVTSIYKDFPSNSDLHYDIVLSLQTLAKPSNLNGNDWANLESMDTQFIETYLVTKSGTNYLALENKLNEVKKKLKPEAMELIRLQPVANMHLPQSLTDYYTTFASLKFIYILQGISILIIIIAWFNYINLSTGSAIKRAKEVGIRKVIGASKSQLVRQFLGESFLLNLCALLIALALINIVQPAYNQLIDKDLSLALLIEGRFWILGLVIILLGSLASGAYTSFALSSFKPSETLKGVFSKSKKGQWMRTSLVVFQFSISIVLIAATLILFRQLHYLQNKDLGMKLEQLVVLSEPELRMDTTFKSRALGFLNELQQQSFVSDYSMSGTVPGQWYNYSGNGYTRNNPQPGDEKINYEITFIDDRYFNIYQIDLLAGKPFTSLDCAVRSRDNNKMIINERAASLFGFESANEAIGQFVINENRKYEVTAVVKDYHHLSPQRMIEPVIFFPMLNSKYFTVKISTEQVQSNMASLEVLYKKYFPGNPFDFFFVNDTYNQQYTSQQQYGNIFTIASTLAIFIACLGLFGLATFTVEQRVKEIGVRKVLGASIPQITILISKDFAKLVFLSILIATPISWYGMDQWLQDFAYRIDITWWIFGIAGGIALLIALITVSSQAINAALSNPVHSLRSE